MHKNTPKINWSGYASVTTSLAKAAYVKAGSLRLALKCSAWELLCL